jgi:hypothetical protein
MLRSGDLVRLCLRAKWGVQTEIQYLDVNVTSLGLGATLNLGLKHLRINLLSESCKILEARSIDVLILNIHYKRCELLSSN